MQEWYLGWEKVSCLERCPQFRSVFIEIPLIDCTRNGQVMPGYFLSFETFVLFAQAPDEGN